jgi:hypothetical protein
MTKPNFESMTRKELLAYMLEHRDDDEAFYAYMDKAYAEPAKEIHPAPKSIDDLKNFAELLEKHRREREERS